jgi:hypothetical protein
MGIVQGVNGMVLQGNLMAYSASFSALTPVATATDFVSLIGSATKNIRLLRVELFGVATAAAVVDVSLIKRTTADTGGASTPIVVPRYDSTDIAATASANTWTANPGVLGTSQGNVRTSKLGLTASPAVGNSLVWEFWRDGTAPVLRGVGEGLHLSWNGAAVPAGTLLNGYLEWDELG